MPLLDSIEEPLPFDFAHHIIEPFGSIRSDQLSVVEPLLSTQENVWIGLTPTGTLLEIDFDTLSVESITELMPDDWDATLPVKLICSHDGGFICVANTLGTTGVVIERRSGRRTMRLQRGDYHSDVSPFPVAFIVHEERTLLLHATDWNRLDISDPATGKLLTERSPTSYETGKEKLPHYLDYFHGRLLISPDQEWIADYGWVWHPVGEVRAWSVRRWLGENLWESEDGTSQKHFCDRAYFWSGPWCWVEDRILAVWGYGDDEECLIPAVCFFNVESGEQISWFAGPEVAPKEKTAWDTFLADYGGFLTFDRYLFAVSGKSGVSVWDHATGVCLHQDTSFAPVGYHPEAKAFLSLLPGGSFQLSHLTDAAC